MCRWRVEQIKAGTEALTTLSAPLTPQTLCSKICGFGLNAQVVGKNKCRKQVAAKSVCPKEICTRDIESKMIFQNQYFDCINEKNAVQLGLNSFKFFEEILQQDFLKKSASAILKCPNSGAFLRNASEKNIFQTLFRKNIATFPCPPNYPINPCMSTITNLPPPIWHPPPIRELGQGRKYFLDRLKA